MEDNKEQDLHLLLYEEIESLKADLIRTRENARKWHRHAQAIDRLEEENRWLRERFYKEQSFHDEARRAAATRNRERFEHFRYSIRKPAKLIEDNLKDPKIRTNYIVIKKLIDDKYSSNGNKYTTYEQVVHPDDHPKHEQEMMEYYPDNYHPGFEVLIKRLIRERDQAVLKLNNLLKTL